MVIIPWSKIRRGVRLTNLNIYGLLATVVAMLDMPVICIPFIHKITICKVRIILITVRGTNSSCNIFLSASSSGRLIFIFDVLYTIINNMIYTIKIIVMLPFCKNVATLSYPNHINVSSGVFFIVSTARFIDCDAARQMLFKI